MVFPCYFEQYFHEILVVSVFWNEKTLFVVFWMPNPSPKEEEKRCLRPEWPTHRQDATRHQHRTYERRYGEDGYG